MLGLRADERGHLAAAGAAPGGPEIQHDRVSAPVGEAESAALERLELEVGRDRADLGCHRRAGREQVIGQRRDAAFAGAVSAAQQGQPERERDGRDRAQPGQHGARAVVFARAVRVLRRELVLARRWIGRRVGFRAGRLLGQCAPPSA